MKPLQLFSFGYYGWGNSTPQLVQAVDAVERARGFKAPIFVDIRIRRAGRAPGFVGTSFENLLGDKRHRWLKELGNRQIITKKGPIIQIAEPRAVNNLLDLAIETEKDRRRLIFFCQCQWPRWCHRAKVVSLALRAARERELNVEFIEWPGGEPSDFDLGVDDGDFNALLRGKWYVPAMGMPLRKRAGIAWGSTATLRCGGERVRAVVGPSQFRQGTWQLPVFAQGDGYTHSEIRRESAKTRKYYGFEPMRSA